MKLDGKRVLVTGASGGIGADLARELAAAGARLALSARRVPELEALADELRAAGAQVVVVPADLAGADGADALAAAAGAALGGVDVLVNNAGMDLVGRPWKEGYADKGERLMQVNVLSPLRLSHRLLGAMIERGDGAVVFLSSVAAWIPFVGGSYYAASKAALARAAEALRMDVKGTGVRVLAVYPGPIWTPMLERGMRNPAFRETFRFLPKGTARELARRIVDALRRDEETVVYPSVFRAALAFLGVSRSVSAALAPAAAHKPAAADGG